MRFNLKQSILQALKRPRLLALWCWVYWQIYQAHYPLDLLLIFNQQTFCAERCRSSWLITCSGFKLMIDFVWVRAWGRKEKWCCFVWDTGNFKRCFTWGENKTLNLTSFLPIMYYTNIALNETYYTRIGLQCKMEKKKSFRLKLSNLRWLHCTKIAREAQTNLG